MTEQQRQVIKIGSRKSLLALWQTEHVQALLQAAHPHIDFEIVEETTHGDDVQNVTLATLGTTNPGLFTKELERSLLDGRTRMAVHSLKDMPTTLPPGLALGAIGEREDPCDALVLHPKHALRCAGGAGLDGLPDGAVIGTSSLRREAMLRRRYPTFRFRPIRGNIHTRLAKLDGTFVKDGSYLAEGSSAALAAATGGGQDAAAVASDGTAAADAPYDAIILAAVGLRRVGLGERISAVLPAEAFPHAVGQGALGVECREDDAEMIALLRGTAAAAAAAAGGGGGGAGAGAGSVHHVPTAARCLAERAVLRGLQGGCQIPLGVHSTISADGMELSVHCQVLSLDGKLCVTGDIGGSAGDAEAMGAALAKQLEADGADAILKPGTRPITYSTVLLDADEQAPAPAAAPAAVTAEQA